MTNIYCERDRLLAIYRNTIEIEQWSYDEPDKWEVSCNVCLDLEYSRDRRWWHGGPYKSHQLAFSIALRHWNAKHKDSNVGIVCRWPR